MLPLRGLFLVSLFVVAFENIQMVGNVPGKYNTPVVSSWSYPDVAAAVGAVHVLLSIL